MTESSPASLRRALADLASRRTLLGAALAGSAGVLARSPEGEAKKRKKRKKRCKNDSKRCGNGCCKAPSVCSAASCFCTGSERNCTSIPQALITLIAEALGVPPGQIGANPDQPLADCPDIPPQEKEQINLEVNKVFGATEPVNWCDGGIDAGVADILENLKSKA